MTMNKLKCSSTSALPMVLLLLAMSTLFLVSEDHEHFYRSGHHGPGNHNYITSQSMALAANLSPEHNFTMFLDRHPDEDGIPQYKSYVRFPIGTYALIIAGYPTLR